MKWKMPIEKEKNEGNANFEKQVQKIIKPKKKKKTTKHIIIIQISHPLVLSKCCSNKYKKIKKKNTLIHLKEQKNHTIHPLTTNKKKTESNSTNEINEYWTTNQRKNKIKNVRGK